MKNDTPHTPALHTRSIGSQQGGTGTSFVTFGSALPAGFIRWPRPVMVRGIHLSSGFVGIDATDTPPHGEVYVIKRSGPDDGFTLGPNNIITGATLTGTTVGIDGLLHSHNYAFNEEGQSFSKSDGVGWPIDEAWKLEQDQLIGLYFATNLSASGNRIQATATVFYNQLDDWEAYQKGKR